MMNRTAMNVTWHAVLPSGLQPHSFPMTGTQTCYSIERAGRGPVKKSVDPNKHSISYYILDILPPVLISRIEKSF